MNNKLFEYLCNDKDFSVRTAEELRCELEAEMQKESPDTDLINELVTAISETENIPPVDVNIESEYAKVTSGRQKKPLLRRFKIIAAAACGIFVISNAFTYSAYGDNLYTLVVKDDNKIHFDFFQSDEKSNESFKYDEYGVKKFYECLGMKIESPMYLPEGFEITEKQFKEQLVTLSDGKGRVDISFMSLKRGLTIDGVDPNESVIYVNGHIATYINDENADWLIYKFDDIVAIYGFRNLSDEEINKIITSIE